MADLFSTYGASSQLPSNKVDAVQWQMREINPTAGVSADGYRPGDLATFQWKPSAARWWSPSRSYLRIRVRIAGTAAGVAATNLDAAAFAAPTPLLPAALLEQCSFSLAGTQIELQTSNVAQAAAFKFRHLNRTEQDAIGPMIGWMPAVAAPSADLNSLVLSRAEYTASQTQEYAFQPPLALFSSPQNIPAADCRLELQINANAFTRSLVPLQGNVPITHLNSTFIGTTTATACSMSIVDIVFMCCELTGGPSDVVNGRIDIPLDMLHVNNTTLTTAGGQHVKISAPATTYRVSAAFQSPEATTGATNDIAQPAIFDSSVDGRRAEVDKPTTSRVQALQISFAGNQAPNPVYRPLLTAAADNGRRAYAEWLQSLPDSIQEPETYDTWLRRGQLYSYAGANVRPAGDRSTDLDVYVESNLAAPGLNLLTFMQSEKVLVCNVSGGEMTECRVIDR